jgi:DNA-binding XRE family transcriptional regulator
MVIEYIKNFIDTTEFTVNEIKNRNIYGAELHKVEYNCMHFNQLKNIIESNKELKGYSEDFKESKIRYLKEQYNKGSINAFRYHRLKNNITQEGIAQILNIPQSNISRLERLKNLENIPLVKAKEIADAFNISIEELLTP